MTQTKLNKFAILNPISEEDLRVLKSIEGIEIDLD